MFAYNYSNPSGLPETDAEYQVNFVTVFNQILSTFEFIDQNSTINSACTVSPETGPCKAAFTKYYFDQITGECKPFTWGGCQGTVPFETFEECLAICEQ
jgi:hypothetical protein